MCGAEHGELGAGGGTRISCTDLPWCFTHSITEQLNAAFHKYVLDVFVFSNLLC